MSGKRAKPSPWRFLRAAPVVVIAVVVWVMVGFFLLLPGSGSDQAHDWDIDPIPSSSDDEGTSDDGESPPAGASELPSPGTASPRRAPAAAPEAAAVSRRAPVPSPDLALSGASTSPRPDPRPTSDPTSPAPTAPASGHGPDDNPGKKKGHHKPHGPPSNQP